MEKTRNYILNESDCVLCLLPFSTPSDATMVTNLWIYSMHASATYHNALINLTRNVHKTSIQHAELRRNRKTRDFADLSKLIN